MASEARLDLRGKPEEVQRLKEAAEKDHRSLSAYLIHHGLVYADLILGEQRQS